MKDYNQMPNEETLNKAVEALKANGFDVTVANNKDDAKIKTLELIKEGSEVMTMTSVTLDELGISKEINESGKYLAVRPKLFSMNRETESKEMNRLGSAPQVSIGSVHAITEDGKVIIASRSGSQLPGYAYGSEKVVWVVGAQKIVKDLDEAMTRINEHTLPLESERAKIAYGVDGSSVDKLLIFNRERPGRISIVILKESVGY